MRLGSFSLAWRDIPVRQHPTRHRESSPEAVLWFCSACPSRDRQSWESQVRPFLFPSTLETAARAGQAAKAGDEAVSIGNYSANSLHFQRLGGCTRLRTQ